MLRRALIVRIDAINVINVKILLRIFWINVNILNKDILPQIHWFRTKISLIRIFTLMENILKKGRLDINNINYRIFSI